MKKQFLKDGTAYHTLNMQQVTTVRANGDWSEFYSGEKRILVILMPLHRTLELHEEFYRIKRDLVVNFDRVSAVYSKEVHLDNGEMYTCNKTYMKAFKKMLIDKSYGQD